MPSRHAALQRLPIAVLAVVAAFISPATSHGRVADAPAPHARTGDGGSFTSSVLAAEGWRGLPDPSIGRAAAGAVAPAPTASPESTGLSLGAAPTAAATLAPPHESLPPPAPAVAPAQPIAPPPTATRPARPAGGWYDDVFTASVRNLVNAERAKAGLGPLSVEPRLAASAAGYAKVLSDDNWFSHVGPDGSTLVTRAEAAGFPFNVQIGEVLAWGTDAWSPAGVVKAWMNSPAHREEILNRIYTRAGTGCYFIPAEGVTVHCVMDLAG